MFVNYPKVQESNGVFFFAFVWSSSLEVRKYSSTMILLRKAPSHEDVGLLNGLLKEWVPIVYR